MLLLRLVQFKFREFYVRSFVKHDNPSLLPDGLPLLPVLVFLRFTRDANNVGKVNLKIYLAVNLEVKLDLHSEPPPTLVGVLPTGPSYWVTEPGPVPFKF